MKKLCEGMCALSLASKYPIIMFLVLHWITGVALDWANTRFSTMLFALTLCVKVQKNCSSNNNRYGY